jgi:phytoene synthase
VTDSVSDLVPVPGAEQTVLEESQQTLAQHARSFHYASFWLPTSVAEDTAIIYAFCRLVDDAVDEAPTRAQAIRNLEQVDAELSGAIPPRPLLVALIHVAARIKLSPTLFQLLISGVRSDLDLEKIPDQAALVRYSYHVAATVGLMMCAAMGVREKWARPYAIDLGLAMQMTNIARDIHEDQLRGRTYVPLTWWQTRDKIQEVDVIRLLDLADMHYRRARQGYAAIPFASCCATSVAGEVYRAIGAVIRQNPTHALRTRVSTSRVQKFLAAIRGIFWVLFEKSKYIVLRRTVRPTTLPLTGQECLIGLYGVEEKSV